MMSQQQGHYQRQFLVGMVGYVVVIIGVGLLIRYDVINSPILTVLIALLPIIPFFYAMVGVIRNARAQDELQRQIYSESVLIAALLTGALTFSYGLLETFKLAPDISMVFVFPLMIFIWGMTNIVLMRRYA